MSLLIHAMERAERILQALAANKVVTVSDLSLKLQVTEETIRKDLEKLEKQEKLIRVHGGAYLKEGYGNETPVSVRSQIMQEEKDLLAGIALSLIKDQTSVFLDASTTMLHLARAIAGSGKKLTVITNSLAAAGELAKTGHIRLILLGGELNPDTNSFEGSSVLKQMADCYIDQAFISSTGVSLEAGITDSIREEAEIRRQAFSQSGAGILVVDNTKIGRNSVYVAGSLDEIAALVTETPDREAARALIRELGSREVPVYCKEKRKK